MDALWNLEDKWNLSTQEAVIFCSATATLVVVVIGLCVAMTYRKRYAKNVAVEPVVAKGSHGQWLRVKKGLTGSVRWSKANKWDESLSVSRKEQPTPLLARGGGEVGWPSHNAASPVWQRPILMGEKCEFPRFSGLILYDEKGKPLDQGNSTHIQMRCYNPFKGYLSLVRPVPMNSGPLHEKPRFTNEAILEQPTVRATLRDLM